MEFDKIGPNKIYEKIGYILGYLLFTAVIFILLKGINKLPKTWNFFHVMGLTFLIWIFALLIKRFLK